MMRFLPLILSFFVSAAFAQPQTIHASYVATWNDKEIGTGAQQFTVQEDGSYELKSESSASGILDFISKDRVVETSTGQIDNNVVKPEKYHYHHSNRLGIKRDGKVDFDWQAFKVTNNVEGSRWQMPIPTGTQDKASMQLALIRALANGERDILFQVADGGKLKHYRFYATGEERQTTALGNFNTIKLAREKNGRAPKVFMWVAPDLDFMPVRILRTKRNRHIDLKLVSLKRSPEKPTSPD